MRVEKATAVAHVFEGHTRAISQLEWAILADLCSLKISLEERAHLSITRAGFGQDGKVDVEAKQVYKEWQDNETANSRDNVGNQDNL